MVAFSPDSAPDPSQQKLIRASRVEHVPVFDDAGNRIGHIDDLSIDRITGQVVYAIMSFGGFLGIGRRYHPLPWDRLHYDPPMGGYIVNLDSAVLRDAPHYGADDLAVFDGHEQKSHAKAIYEYYGLFPPYL